MSQAFDDIVGIDENGRLVIPPEILQQIGWVEGMTLDVTVGDDGRVTLRPV